MFIIFGFRRRVATLIILSLTCRNGHLASHRVLKMTRWFTLFFIPVIPFSRKYVSICAHCGLQLEIPKAAADDLLARPAGMSTSPDLAVGPTNGATPPAGWYEDP